MKIIPGFKVRGFILAAAFSAGVGFATSASAQYHSYLVDLNSKTATDIGTLGGDLTPEVSGINDAGQVAGASVTAGGASPCVHHRPRWDGHERPWHFGGGWISRAGINDAGQVVGHSYMAGDAPHAFMDFSESQGINDAGQVVGHSWHGWRRSTCFHYRPQRDGHERPWHFSWWPQRGSRHQRRRSGGGLFFDRLEAHLHAFITGPDGMGMRDLGTLGSS